MAQNGEGLKTKSLTLKKRGRTYLEGGESSGAVRCAQAS
jgi:hypothetical protein